VELVGIGDHLAALAEALGTQGSPAARDLRLFVLHRTLATVPAEAGTGRFLAPLTRSLTTAITSGEASRRPDMFATMLADAGAFLVEAGGEGNPATLSARRDALAREIGGGSASLAPGPIVTAATPEPEPEPGTPPEPTRDVAEPEETPAVAEVDPLEPRPVELEAFEIEPDEVT
jgi:hypothetical protein